MEHTIWEIQTKKANTLFKQGKIKDAQHIYQKLLAVLDDEKNTYSELTLPNLLKKIDAYVITCENIIDCLNLKQDTVLAKWLASAPLCFLNALSCSLNSYVRTQNSFLKRYFYCKKLILCINKMTKDDKLLNNNTLNVLH